MEEGEKGNWGGGGKKMKNEKQKDRMLSSKWIFTTWMEQEFKWTSTMIYIVYQMDETLFMDEID
jgi:hypothetical protein